MPTAEKENSYLITQFTMYFAQFLHINLTFTTSIFAEQIASY